MDIRFVQLPWKEFGWEAGHHWRFEYKAPGLAGNSQQRALTASYNLCRDWLVRNGIAYEYKLIRANNSVYFRINDPAAAMIFKLEHC